MTSRHLARTAVAAFALTVALTGCAVAQSSESTPVPATVDETAVSAGGPTASTPSPPTTPPTCATLTGEEAFDKWSPEVPAPQSPWTWAPLGSYGTHDYDPCAVLSSIVISDAQGTVSTPCHVMLFHYGEFVGTATPTAYAYEPDVIPFGDSGVEITYPYFTTGDSHADPSGKAVAWFTWNDDTQSIDMTGELPPA